MEPRIEQRGACLIAGVQVRCNPKTADYGDIWSNRYMPFDERLKSFSADQGYYGVSFATETPGIVDYLAGMAVTQTEGLPDGLVVREVPAGEYAVFATSLDAVGQTWEAVYQEWIPMSAYDVAAPGPDFEFYPPGAATGDAPVYICVPVRHRMLAPASIDTCEPAR